VEHACANGGTINHALRMTLAGTANSYIWPATTAAGSYTVPSGARARLQASYNMSGFSSCAQVVLTAMKDYGLFVADNGAGWQVQLEADAWPANLISVFNEIQNASIGPSNFEYVDESSLEISSKSGEANVNRETICYTASTGKTCTDVILEGVGVNLPQNIAYIMAGTPSQQFTAFVHDGQSNTVTWSMSPSIGSLTTGGLYTPPSLVSSPTSTTITATNTVNSSAAASMTLWVFPASGFYGMSATTTGFTGHLRNLWTAGAAYGTSNVPALLGCCQFDGSFPTNITDYQLYQNHLYSSINNLDIDTNFFVPAGTYKITYYLGPTYPAGQKAFTFISQGKTLASDIDPTAAAGGEHLPYTYTTTQTVGSDNQLSFYIWGTGGARVAGADISAISVVSVGSALAPPTNLTATVQ
jgi:hypothetical protein